MSTLIDLIREKSIKDPSVLGDHELITFLNPYSYLLGRKELETFKKFDRIYVDGISLVNFLKLTGLKNTRRASFDFTSVARVLFEHLSKTVNETMYLIGSTEEYIQESMTNIHKDYPEINIVGYRNGYFSNGSERRRTIEEINKLNPDYVIVGMGTPLQEKFLVDLRNSGWNGTGYTCGGFIHQSADKLKYYPEIYNKTNMRWIYRIKKEPKLFKRYFYEYPKSFFYLMKDMRSN